jgi:hypothetical protein
MNRHARDRGPRQARLIRRRLLLTGLSAAVAVAVAGCADRSISRQVAAMNDSRIKQLANLFRFYQATNGWVGPKDEATLRSFVQAAPRKNLDMMGIDPSRFEEMLVSDRDGKPFAVRWGVSIGPMEEQAVVFEAEGRDGRRLVAYTGARTEEVDAERYAKLFAGEGVVASAMSGPPAAAPSGGSPGPRP